jgi:membrane protein implicated in regulation of membrane protease activity
LIEKTDGLNHRHLLILGMALLAAEMLGAGGFLVGVGELIEITALDGMEITVRKINQAYPPPSFYFFTGS